MSAIAQAARIMFRVLFGLLFTFVRLYFYLGTGPSEGWRGEDQGRLRSAFGGHAERLPYVGRMRLPPRAASTVFISEPSTAEAHSTPSCYPTPAYSPVLYCEWVWVYARFHVEGKEKDALYSLFVASFRRTLDPLRGHWSCMRVWIYCVWKRDLSPVSSFLCLHDFCAWPCCSSWRGLFSWCNCNSWTICTEEYWI